MKKISIIFFILIAFSNDISASFAQTPLNIIYLHGFNAFDEKVVEKEAKTIAQALKGKTIGDKYFTGQYKAILWSDIFKCDNSYKIYCSSLERINNEHNITKINPELNIEGQKIKIFTPVLHPTNKGAGPIAIYARNLVNSFLYQIFFFKNSPKSQKIVLDRIQKTIDNTNTKFVIIAHSFGATVALDFLDKRIIGNQNNENKFAGLITSADLNATINANYWAEENNMNLQKLKNFIIENDKFWICINHRNDIAATGLPTELTLNNSKDKGFIAYETTKSKFFNSYTSFIRPFDSDNGKIKAHLWMHIKPKDFAKKVIKIYQKNHD